MLLEGKGDDASKKTLYEAEDVVDRRAYLPHGFKNVAVENHLPLDPTLWGEKRACVDGELELELRTCGKADGGAPDG